MQITGLNEWEKKRLASELNNRGHTSFLVIQHAKAAVHSAQKGYPIHKIDTTYLKLLDELILELYGYQRKNNELSYIKTLENHDIN